MTGFMGLLCFSGAFGYLLFQPCHSTNHQSSRSLTAEPQPPQPTLRRVIAVTHYLSPVLLSAVLFTVFVIRCVLVARRAPSLKAKSSPKQSVSTYHRKSHTLSSLPSAKRPETLDFSPGRRAFFVGASTLLLFTLVGNAGVIAFHATLRRAEEYWSTEDYVIYISGTLCIYILAFIALIDARPSPTILHASIWTFSLIFEILLLVASIALYSRIHHEGKAFDPVGGRFLTGFTRGKTLELVFDAIRVLLLVLLLSFYNIAIFHRHKDVNAKSKGYRDSTDERTRLLSNHVTGNGCLSYQAGSNADTETQKEGQAGWVRPVKLPSATGWQYISSYSHFFKYLWPSKSPLLKARFFICVLLLAVGRGVNVLVPYQAGKLTDLLASKPNSGTLWAQLGLFIVYRLLQGNSGLIASLRSYLWIPIGQYSHRELATSIFEHVHWLSMKFHVDKKTGELISAMNKGDSINGFLDQTTFQIGPMIVDLCVAVVYLGSDFGIYYSLIVGMDAFVYIYITVRLAQWRAGIKREVTNLDRQEDAVKTDSIGLYETVKYFNAEHFEFDRYRNVIDKYQKKQYILNTSVSLMNASQNLCFTVGLTAVCFLAAFQISIGQLQVGKFVSLLTYMNQLAAPLNYFASYYKTMQSSMINAERILELFKEAPTIVDDEFAHKMTECEGKITFRNVGFAYDARRPALTALSFTCEPGTKTALVGASGVGKSTVFRLLYRFYDVDRGSIAIDDKDVDYTTVESLRRFIGIVPQDTPLFNESIIWNVRYAKQDATDEEVFEACRAASIHDRILEFPYGYMSQVGDRGVKLSGGEKQRIAIARTILKNPRILMLDEATAALDSETEQKIEKSIDKISKGRTTLIIAHRLSTIANCDQILVLHEGRVAEKGTHAQLLELNGRYKKMWEQNFKAEKAELHASEKNKGRASPGRRHSTPQSGAIAIQRGVRFSPVLNNEDDTGTSYEKPSPTRIHVD